MRTRYANNIRGGGVFFPEGAAHRVLANGRHTLLRPRKPGIKIRLRKRTSETATWGTEKRIPLPGEHAGITCTYYATSQKPPKKNEIKREHLPCSIPAHALSKLPKRASQRTAPLFASYIVGTFCTFMPIAGTRALCTLGFLISHEKEKGSSAARLITRIRRQNERHFLERKKSLRSPTETAFARLKVGPLTQMHASYRFLSLAQLWSPWEGRRETG